MKGLSRRARVRAVAAATGVAVLAGAGAAQAQAPAKVGEGVPTGQGSVQLFNYGGWINNGGGGGTANPITSVANAPDGSSCATSTSTDCRWNRLEALFAFLARKGATGVELFGHSAFPANNDTAGLERYRALLDKYNLHAAGWHGDMSEAAWDARLNAAKILGADYIGSGGFPSPGIGSYENTLRTVEALNRLGKKSVEAGVGPVYFHNHQQEFRNRYVDNGVLKTAWQIVMERMDPRYAVAEVDAFWSSDAYDDVTGEKTAALINQFPNSVKMLHIKDGVGVAQTNGITDPLACGQTGQPACQNASPRALGTGEVDFRPIFAAAKDRVQYYHQEHDGGTLTDADISLTNLKGTGSNVKPSVLGLPTTFPSVAAGTPASANVVAVKLQNTGDAALNITALALATGNNAKAEESPQDFQILSNSCVGTPVAAATAPTAQNPGGTRSSCIVNIGFKPTRTSTTSVSRLLVTSNADNGTEQIYLVGKSTADSLGSVGGDVPSSLSLTLGGTPSFGSFTPAFAKTYETAASATVVSTAGSAALTVADTSATAPGHLVNGTFALPQALQVRATNAANPGSAYQPLPEITALPVNLLTYTGPTAGAETVTLGFRQGIGASDTLRAGSYTKTLTFSLSTTQP